MIENIEYAEKVSARVMLDQLSQADIDRAAMVAHHSPGYEQFAFNCAIFELYSTQVALRSLNIGINNSPDQIPGVNKLTQVERSHPPAPLTLEIMGLPCTGKDTLTAWLIDHPSFFPGWYFKFIPEAYTLIREQAGLLTPIEIEQQKDKVGGRLPLKSLEELFVLKNLTAAEHQAMLQQDYRNVPGVAFLLHRGVCDRHVFQRSQFLAGKINYPDYYHLNRLLLSQRQGYLLGPCHDATLIFLNTPQEAIARGSHTPVDFLTLLYEQYLRFYAEAQKQHIPNLAVLDMSGPIAHNQTQFRGILKQILGPQRKHLYLLPSQNYVCTYDDMNT